MAKHDKCDEDFDVTVIFALEQCLDCGELFIYLKSEGDILPDGPHDEVYNKWELKLRKLMEEIEQYMKKRK